MDNAGGSSNPASCQQTISVSSTIGTTPGGGGGGGTSSGSAQPTQQIIYVTATPQAGALAQSSNGSSDASNGSTIPTVGPGDALLGIGMAGIALSILGGLIFFVL